MRRLPGILLATGAILIVVVALLISGLRLVLPELNHYRPQLLEKVQAIAGVPVEADYVQGSWETFGPTLEARNIRLALPKSTIQIERVTLALDVWQSLLHWRWQFRDLTFYQLQLDLNTTLGVKAVMEMALPRTGSAICSCINWITLICATAASRSLPHQARVLNSTSRK